MVLNLIRGDTFTAVFTAAISFAKCRYRRHPGEPARGGHHDPGLRDAAMTLLDGTWPAPRRRRELSLVQRLRLLPGGYVGAGNRAGRCPDDHVSCGQVDAQAGQPGDQAGLPGNAGDTAAAQNKRASVHDVLVHQSGAPARDGAVPAAHGGSAARPTAGGCSRGNRKRQPAVSASERGRVHTSPLCAAVAGRVFDQLVWEGGADQRASRLSTFPQPRSFTPVQRDDQRIYRNHPQAYAQGVTIAG